MKIPLLLGLAWPAIAVPAAPVVHLWETNLVIPTYLAAPPSPVPRFYEGRTYQGAKATFYPYPVQDVLTDVKTNKTYKALFLENQYIQIAVIPELGGRIWSAMDKANGYDFFYRQHVVKPALIGMLGAWISGGVEWNVPHHHRASSFMPVDTTTTTNADGSATIWVGEIELRHRTKWLVGMTLYPDRSYLELTCKVFNRTPFAWPMLFWINPAVHANEHYQVLFPPSTEWATQHGKPEFASWPIARQTYGGTDYTRGVDISWWKNHDTPKSFFAWNYEDDWFGGYDHGRQAGVLHVADHHVVPGKKFFEWGNGPEGEMWTKILTDEDGPYLELMAGAWSDNQPDYSWIQPGETREWQHWWYPIRNLGGVKAANRDVAVNLEVTNRVAKVAVNATTLFTNVEVALMYRQADIWRLTTNISPVQPFSMNVPLREDIEPGEVGLSVMQRSPYPDVTDQTSKPLLFTCWPQRPKNSPMPKPVEKPKSPKDYASTDELYFTGQRIEQLYSPSFEAQPYYEEILRRDPGDYRANTAMGILLCKQWHWEEAANYLSNAIARATANYIRPKDGEAFYYLGVALQATGNLEGAADMFQKALWSPGRHSAINAALVELAAARGDKEALTALATKIPLEDAHSPYLFMMKMAALQGGTSAVEEFCQQRLAADPLDVVALSLADLFQSLPALAVSAALGGGGTNSTASATAEGRFPGLLPGRAQTAVELMASMFRTGAWEAISESGTNEIEEAQQPGRPVDPLLAYYQAYAADQMGDAETALFYSKQAAALPADFCFPHRWEDEPVLRRAMQLNSKDARAAYLLGCLLYDNQPENAITAWEESRRRDDQFALTHRNLALAYAQHEQNIPKAIASLERAIALDPNEPRFFYELDRLYEAGGAPVAKRLETLTRHYDTVTGRDDALTREIVLLTVAGQADRALELLRGRHFRNWEGSSQIHSVYVDACLARGQQLLAAKQPRAALRQFEAALEYPDNLEVGKARRSPNTAQIQYLIGTAHAALGDPASAKAAFTKAAAGRERGASEGSYFRALAQQKLGRAAEALAVFERLVKAGEEQLTQGEAADYFAKFGEKTSERVRQANAHYLIGLGQWGLGQREKALEQFAQAETLHPAHLGARTMARPRNAD